MMINVVTYFHESLGHNTWIDHVFISESADDAVGDFIILDSGCNNSDHHPILWSLQYDGCKVDAGSAVTGLNSAYTDNDGIKQIFCSIMPLLVPTCSLFMFLHICYMIITACAVATSCCISDQPSQWERPNFDPP